MATSFASLKKSRKSNLEKLQSEVDKINNPKTNFIRDDDRFWKAELDKSGNGYAVIRFLPATNGEDMPSLEFWYRGEQRDRPKTETETDLLLQHLRCRR